MNVMVWYRNSILGSMLFISIILISSERHYLLLAIILLCSFISEYFISKYTFKWDTQNVDLSYRTGKVIEFLAIVIPIIFFALENYFGFESVLPRKINDLSIIKAIPIAVLGVYILVGYIESIYKPTGNQKEQSIEPITLLDGFLKQVFNIVLNFINIYKRIKHITTQALPDKNRASFQTIWLSWTIYITMTAAVIDFILPVPGQRLLGLVMMIVIAIVDWCILSKRLLDYYIQKMKEGRYMLKFREFFINEWENCLRTLNEFDEISAKQFMIGDRLRPIMFFMGSSYKRYTDLDDKDYEDIAKAACSVELIHKSSVMFDDYIDEDDMRKGEMTFHVEYPNSTKKMILLGNAMLAKAQVNFVECRDSFKCNDKATIDNTTKLSQIIIDMCTGCYKELPRADYDKQKEDEVKNIIYLETVSLIKRSIGLGYSCFHDDQGHEDHETIEQLGEAFGYIFQYLNDL